VTTGVFHLTRRNGPVVVEKCPRLAAVESIESGGQEDADAKTAFVGSDGPETAFAGTYLYQPSVTNRSRMLGVAFDGRNEDGGEHR
jgi:hypothetical protein